ncbi:SpaA isopeptide-forming pilin-related protein [Enterococcus sp. BWT-B8]|uniref:MSCRAMM family protein n=1 Tax=Enterococcus sp. BWT-B8 TaxID=2885157 RepID=UPI00226CCA1E
MFWKEANGLNVNSILRMDGTPLSNYQAIKDKINQVIADYEKKPSFTNQTIKVVLGQSVTVTDTNNTNLNSFKETNNSTNSEYKINGNNLTFTPNVDSTSGSLKFRKSVGFGTPVAYKLAGQQSVVAGAIDIPNEFTINLEVIKNGNLKIVKKDKESGKLVPDTVFHVTFDNNKFPARDVKTGEDGTITITEILHGTKVTITEKEVPKSYTIDTTPMVTTIKASEAVEVISTNYREKGQIQLNKEGVETGITQWNEHYSLAGNTFDIRKDDPNGTIVQTIITNEKGYAETA